MSIRVERKGDRIKVETDYAGADVDHSMIHEDRKLIAGMKICGINEIEASKTEGGVPSALHREFERKYKEKNGEESTYYSYW